MTDRLKTLKSLSFGQRRAGRAGTSFLKSKTIKEQPDTREAKPGRLSKLLSKVPAHTFKRDAFDHVGTRTHRQNDDGKGNRDFIGTHNGTRGSSSLEFGKGALTGQYSREALAGAYLQKSGSVTGKNGSAAYDAELKAEALARVDAHARLDSNGVKATVNARANVSVEVNVSGSASTRKVTIAGVQTDAGIAATGRAVAELNAEATATAQITRHPPTAILEGKAGASAVAKVEGDIQAHVGPFSVRGSAYASAGAEATASGILGYRDGKLQIGGSAGAAFGLGAGGNAVVEVDVKQIKDAAVHVAVAAADRNHDGKVTIGDVGAGLHQVANAASTVKNTASKWKNRLFG